MEITPGWGKFNNKSQHPLTINFVFCEGQENAPMGKMEVVGTGHQTFAPGQEVDIEGPAYKNIIKASYNWSILNKEGGIIISGVVVNPSQQTVMALSEDNKELSINGQTMVKAPAPDLYDGKLSEPRQQ